MGRGTDFNGIYKNFYLSIMRKEKEKDIHTYILSLSLSHTHVQGLLRIESRHLQETQTIIRNVHDINT